MFRLKFSPRWLMIVLAAAFVLRLGAALGVQTWLDRQSVPGRPSRLCLIDGDADGYWKLAQSLARGQGFSVYEPPRQVLRMPGFPLLISAGMLIYGDSPGATRVLLAGVGTAACGFVFLLGRELFDAETGLAACIFATLNPAMILFSVLLLSETLFALCALASLWAFARLVCSEDAGMGTQYGWGRGLAAGVLCGAATLVRPTWLVIGPLLAAVDLLRHGMKRRAIVRSGALCAGLAIALLPWIVRNAVVTGRFVPTTLWVGPSLYDGLNPHATGASDMNFVEADGIYQQMSEYDADRHYRSATWNFVRNNPVRALELTAIKLWRFWSPVPNAPQFAAWYLQLAVAAVYVPVLVFAAIGAWRARRRHWCWIVPAAPMLCFAAVHAVFIGSLRYRLPVEYPLLVLSAAGVISLWGRPRPGSAEVHAAE
jgi:4-amino-4-deoxy-L-arabinose transferase-like glycosyltransferase